jgi:hypothetical protein
VGEKMHALKKVWILGPWDMGQHRAKVGEMVMAIFVTTFGKVSSTLRIQIEFFYVE